MGMRLRVDEVRPRARGGLRDAQRTSRHQVNALTLLTAILKLADRTLRLTPHSSHAINAPYLCNRRATDRTNRLRISNRRPIDTFHPTA